jgi:hypothetical protein
VTAGVAAALLNGGWRTKPNYAQANLIADAMKKLGRSRPQSQLKGNCGGINRCRQRRVIDSTIANRAGIKFLYRLLA